MVINKWLQLCFLEMKSWLRSNMLVLNDDKTVALVVKSNRQAVQLAVLELEIGDALISPPTSANFGFHFRLQLVLQGADLFCVQEELLTPPPHCQHQTSPQPIVVVQSSPRFRHINTRLRKLAACWSSLYSSATSSVGPEFGRQFCYGYNSSGLRHRLLEGSALAAANAMPISFRVQFKILVLTYHALHKNGREYIGEIIGFRRPARTLRSGDSSLLSLCHTLARSPSAEPLLLLLLLFGIPFLSQ